jgi:PPM family protein phosphatase
MAKELSYILGSKSHVGMKREENQDSFGDYVVPHTDWSLMVICDGMGGHFGGSTASKLALESISNYFIENIKENKADDILFKAIEAGNFDVFDEGMRNVKLRGMGTTCVAIALKKNKVILGHVGDSRIYLIQKNMIFQLTKDHTALQYLIDAGLVSEENAEHHPNSGVLSQAIGTRQELKPEVQGPFKVKQGDLFLQCSDGLYNHVKPPEMAAIAMDNSPDDAASKLIDLANSRGGKDNITIQIISIGPHKKSKPEKEILFIRGNPLYEHKKSKNQKASRIDSLSGIGKKEYSSKKKKSKKPTKNKKSKLTPFILLGVLAILVATYLYYFQ